MAPDDPRRAGPRSRVRPWMLGALVWFVPAVFAVVSELARRQFAGRPATSLRQVLMPGASWLTYVVLTPIVFWTSSRWPVARPYVARRIALHLGLAVLACAAWVTFGALIGSGGRGAAGGVHSAAALIGTFMDQLLNTLTFGVIIYLCIAVLAHASQLFLEARDREVQMARMSEQLADANFSALQARLNPHFLFNTLNTIAVRARDADTAGTVRMVDQLSDLLRRTLSRHAANEVPLRDELDLVRQYLNIEQARFSDRLHPEFAIDEAALDVRVPSFALQHLVENAIRHGIAKRSGAGRVRVTARRDGDTLDLAVSDDGPGIDDARAAVRGHGIDNTRERLRALHGDGASLTVARAPSGGTVSTLRVPWRALPAAAANAGR